MQHKKSTVMQSIFLLLIIIRASLDYYANIQIFGINPASYVALITILMFLLEFLSTQKKKKIKSNGYLQSYGIYLLCLLPSVIASSSFVVSVEELLKYLCQFSCIYLVLRYMKRDVLFIIKLFRAMLASCIIPLIYGFYQLFTHQGLYDKEVGGLRVNSVFTHPNQYAIYLVVIITVSLLILFNRIKPQKKNDRRFAIIALVGCTINLLFTYSRTCWIWVGVIIIGVLIHNLNNKYMIAGGMVLVVFAYFALDIIISRFLDISQGGTRNSLGIREAIIVRMLSSVLQKPIFGHGLGVFDIWSTQFMGIRIQAHNEYFKTLFESGILGLLGLVYYLISTIVRELKFGLKKKYIPVYFFIGFIAACYFTNTLSSLVGQIYLVSMVAAISTFSLYVQGSSEGIWGKNELD